LIVKPKVPKLVLCLPESVQKWAQTSCYVKMRHHFD